MHVGTKTNVRTGYTGIHDVYVAMSVTLDS